MKINNLKFSNTNIQPRSNLAKLVSSDSYEKKIAFSMSFQKDSKFVAKDLGNGYSELVQKIN